MRSSMKQCAKEKRKIKSGGDEEAYMRWYEVNTIMLIGRGRLQDKPQGDPPPQPNACSLIVPENWV